jgi:hypothetical protein
MSKNAIFRARVDAEKVTPEKIAQFKLNHTSPFFRDVLTSKTAQSRPVIYRS